MTVTTAAKTITINSKKFGIARAIVVTQDFHTYGYGNKKWAVTINGEAPIYVTRFATKQFGTRNNSARYSTLADAVAAVSVTLTANQAAQINAIAA